MSDDFRQRRKSLHLGDDINISIRIRLPAFAADDPARMSSTGSIAGTRNGHAEFSVGILGIFFQHSSTSESLLITQFDSAQVENRILHCNGHTLALSTFFT